MNILKDTFYFVEMILLGIFFLTIEIQLILIIGFTYICYCIKELICSIIKGDFR